MSDLSRTAVDAALARILDDAITAIDGTPGADKLMPLLIAKAQIRRVQGALRGQQQLPPAPNRPMRKLAIVGRYEGSPALTRDCTLRPRQTGDHACARCRARIKATYEQYQRAASQETES